MLDLLSAPGGHIVPTMTITVVVVGLVVLAALDVWHREVEDYATVLLMGVAVIGMHLEGVSLGQWLGSIFAAVVAFCFYLELGKRGLYGGGDVKLAIVPAFALAAIHPIIGLWWIVASIAIQEVFHFVNTRINKERSWMPHVPAMAMAAFVATVAFPATF